MNTLNGTVEITLLEVQPVHIHNSLYYQVQYRLGESDVVQAMRINPEAFYPNPQPGDRVSVQMVMGNIMGARKVS